LGIEIAERSASSEERPFVERMKKLRDEHFWPGRGIDIMEDFPVIAEQKFWSRVFLDTSRAIFDRKVGVHQHSFWQAQSIHQAYSTGFLFEKSVKNTEPTWYANTVDRREFNKVVNGIENQ